MRHLRHPSFPQEAASSHLIQFPVFSLADVRQFYPNEKTVRVALERLLRNNMALKIRNGLYTCLSGESGGSVANRYQIVSVITPLSYVSHHTAFEYYGILNQVFLRNLRRF